MAVMPLQDPRPVEMPIPVGKPARDTARPPRRPGRWFALGAVLLVLAIGLGAIGWQMFLRPLTIEVANVGSNVPLQVFGLGTVGADVESEVGFKVSGIINEIGANEGDHVKTGQVLARLDASDIAAQVAQARAGVLAAQAAIKKGEADVANAEASLVNAKAVAARREVLVKEGFASAEETQIVVTAMRVATANLRVAQVEVESARAGLAAALAQQAFSKATLANYTLRSPYDGWVLARSRNLGDAVVPGQTVFTLTEPRTIWVVGYVDERLAGRLRVGQKAEIALRSEPGRRFPGHVARIEIQSDAVNEERLVDVAFDHLPPDIHLAEQAEVTVTTGTLAHAVLVPQSAVGELTGDRGASEHGTVWTVEDGRLARHAVTFGPQLLDGRLPVVGGLPRGAQVVVSPRTGLRAGRAARIAAGPS